MTDAENVVATMGKRSGRNAEGQELVLDRPAVAEQRTFMHNLFQGLPWKDFWSETVFIRQNGTSTIQPHKNGGRKYPTCMLRTYVVRFMQL